jgi:VWFA-related protein
MSLPRLTPFVFAAAALISAADGPTFQVKASLVKADVYVYDKESHSSIVDLAADDFVVHDGDDRRDITHFGNETAPLDLVFLVDVSGSVRDVLPKVSEAVVDALSVLDEHDRAAVMAFSKKTVLTQPLTADAPAVAEGIRAATAIQIGLDTDINQAVWSAADYLYDSRGNARRAVLVISDNMQETRVADSLVDEQLSVAGVVVDGFLLRGAIPLPRITHPGILRFARNTGGEILEGNQPASRLAEMIRRIKFRYSIHFRPVETQASAPRKIHIELAAPARAKYPHAELKFRRIYFPQGQHRPKIQLPSGQTLALAVSRRDRGIMAFSAWRDPCTSIPWIRPDHIAALVLSCSSDGFRP